jgi:hypothetical protein
LGRGFCRGFELVRLFLSLRFDGALTSEVKGTVSLECVLGSQVGTGCLQLPC